MFTGIIEKTARVIGCRRRPTFRRLTLANAWPDVRPGESIAVNGVCLTVAEISPGELGFDVIAETLGKNQSWPDRTGDAVHVERSLRIGDRVDAISSKATLTAPPG